MEKKLPKILSNIPEGKDLFKAESHQKIAGTIISIVENQSDVIDKQIIGLEGDWGTGKSNIIKIVEEKSKDKYLHFTYDTWTHQEDLTRKSILQELINFLKNDASSVIDGSSLKWKTKEDELSQKVISKSTQYFPRIKGYYIFLILAFIIIKFGNEFSKQVIGGKVFGFYDNSIKYLTENFHIELYGKIKWEYVLKMVPFVLILLGVLLFFYSVVEEIRTNVKKEKDKRLPISMLIGKIFYWVSGEKLESNSNEIIKEDEPSNLRFRRFLKDIDNELGVKKKILLLTIDNTDRLTDAKMKNVWSTINIFFAESNNEDFLKNIWLIIPYDEKKVLGSFEDSKIGIGLLEKTFAITFKVPPPLSSNWEIFFEFCFNKSFQDVEITERQTEVEILLRIFEYYQKEITPRKIINFINQIATYCIQNSKIQLRYFALIILNKNVFFEDSINENIIDRKKYLAGLDSLFIDDEKLEINLSKIIYGIESDEDAAEALLSNEIYNVLSNDLTFDDKLLNTPAFAGYFFKYFKKYVDREMRESVVNDPYFDKVSKILLALKDLYLQKNKINIYKSMWEGYYKHMSMNKFLVFDESIRGVILYCSKNTKIEFINSILHNIITHKPNGKEGIPKENQKLYLEFLKHLDEFLTENKVLTFKDIKIDEQLINAEFSLDLIKDNKEDYVKFKFKCSESSIKEYFVKDTFDSHLNVENLIDYKQELIFLKEQVDLKFIEDNINKYWLQKEFKSIDQINAFMFYYLNLGDVKIDSLSSLSYYSIVTLINDTIEEVDLSFLFYLLFINYDLNESDDIKEDIKEALLKIHKTEPILKLLNKDEFKSLPEIINILKIALEFEDLPIIRELSESIIQKNLIDFAEEDFNWLLQNYSDLNSLLFKTAKFNFYEYLNKEAKNHQVDIVKIDIEILNSSSKYLNTELVRELNTYLSKYIKENTSFLQNHNLKEFKLFKKLLDINKVKKEVLEDLKEPFFNLVLSNRVNPEIGFTELNKIKSTIEVDEIKNFINKSLNRLVGRETIFMLTPEIFDYFERLQNNYKTSFLQILVKKPEYYNVELFREVIKSGNNSLLALLKTNLQNTTDNKLREFAMTEGLIEPNPN